jgi:hypothetical protein
LTRMPSAADRGLEAHCAQLPKNLAVAPTNRSQHVVYYTHLGAEGQVPASGKFHSKRLRPGAFFRGDLRSASAVLRGIGASSGCVQS